MATGEQDAPEIEPAAAGSAGAAAESSRPLAEALEAAPRAASTAEPEPSSEPVPDVDEREGVESGAGGLRGAEPEGDAAASEGGDLDGPSERPPWRRWLPSWRQTLLGVAGALILFILVQWLTWPDVGKLVDENPETTAFMDLYRQRAAARDLPELRQRWVPSARISANLKHAILVSEDIDFFDHEGFAVEEMKIALREAWKEKELPRGASTLTQQLVKNLWLSPSRNPWRKVKEALLTRQVEAELEKHRILEIYLNVVEFGPGVYGAEAAARAYFGKSAAGLSEAEGAALAAALPRPSHWHPGSGSRTAARRQERILGRMAKSSWLRKSL